MNKYSHFLKSVSLLAESIATQEDKLITELGKYETYDAARDEIERSIDALRGVENEFADLKSGVDDLTICTFFPLNLPLYSLVLFAVIPGAFAEKVYVRAPTIMHEVMLVIAQMLGLETLFPQIIIKDSSRTAFLELYAQTADVILFTGRYDNALIIQRQCPGALFIFNGGGVNPAVVYEDADIELAADKVFEMRTFNSGQDCAGTDAIFVHISQADELVRLLERKAAGASVGTYGDPATEIGPILKKEYIDSLVDYLASEDKHIRLRGKVDSERSIVYPAIILKKASEHSGGFHEFFAPIFYVLVFDDEREVLDQLSKKSISDYSMYISYFSEKDRLSSITYARLLKNHIINDVEQGNMAYGGFGEKANFVAFGQKRECRPILISREIDNFYVEEDLS